MTPSPTSPGPWAAGKEPQRACCPEPWPRCERTRCWGSAVTDEPGKDWDEQLRAALTDRANSIDAVTSWSPPTEHRHAHRYPWRWLTPPAVAAAVALIVVGVAVTRLAADRDVRPVSSAPATTWRSGPTCAARI